MPKVKINKHQAGGRLSFLVENNPFDIDENAMDAQINTFIDSDPRLKRSKDAILNEYNATKTRLRQGASNGQFFNIDVGGDQAINIATNLDLTNAQKGLTDSGKTAKPGLLSSLTGTKSDAVISGAINKFIGDSVSRAYNQHMLDSEAKRKLEEDKATTEKLKAEADAKDAKTKEYGRLMSNLDLGNAYYGLQLGMGDHAQSNYQRYHSGKDKDRYSADINYLNQLKTAFGNEDLSKDADFAKNFLDKSGTDFTKFKTTLMGLNLQDPKLNVQSAMDSLGLGAEYSRLRDSSIYRNMQEKANVPTNNGGGGGSLGGGGGSPEVTVPPETTEPPKVDANGVPIQVTTPENMAANNDVLAQASSGIARTTFSPNYYRFGKLINYNGKNYTAKQYLDLEREQGFSDATLNPLANSLEQSYRGAVDDYRSNANVLKNTQWSDFQSLKSTDNFNPYYGDSWGTKDIEGYNDITAMFSGATDPSSRVMKFSVVDESLKNGDIRSRYIDQNGEHFGYYTADDEGNAVFNAVDGNNNVISVKKLGKINPQAIENNMRAGINTYVWKSKLQKYRLKGEDKALTSKMQKLAVNTQNALQATKRATNTGSFSPQFSQAVIDRLVKSTEAKNAASGKFKKGGVLKFQSGGQNYSMANFLKKGDGSYATVSNKSDGRTTTAVNMGTLKDDNYKLTDADKMELTGLALDLTGLVGGLVTGNTISGIGAAGAGAMGTYYSNKAAEARGEEVSNWNKALMYGLDAASAIPLAGVAAKTFKSGKALQKSLKVVSKLAQAYGLAGMGKAAMAMSNGEVTVANAQTLLSGLMAFGLNTKADTRRGLEYNPNKNSSYTFGEGSKKTKINFTPEESVKFRQTKGNDQRALIQSAGARQGIDVDPASLPKQWKLGGRKYQLDGEFAGVPKNWNFKRGGEWLNDTANSYDLREKGFKFGGMAGIDRVSHRTVDRAKKAYFTEETIGLPEAGSTKNYNNPWMDKAKASSEQSIVPPKVPDEISTTPHPANPQPTVTEETPSRISSMVMRSGEALANFKAKTTQVKDNLTEAVKASITKLALAGSTLGAPKSVNSVTNRGVYGTSVPNTPSTFDQPSSVGLFDIPTVAKPKKATKPKASTKKTKNVDKAQLGLKLPKFILPSVKIDPKAPNPFKRTGSLFSTTSSPTLPLNGIKAPVTTTTAAFGKDPGLQIKDNRKTFSLKANPYDISEGFRALNKIFNTNKIDTRVEAPLVSNPLEIAPAVKSNVGLTGLYATMANRLRNTANQTGTSDAGLNMTARLNANAKANEFEMQGAVQNAESILRQEAEANALARQYAANRTATANQNANTIANKIQAERGLSNERIATNLESIDNLWASMNAKGLQRQRESANIRAMMAGQELANSPLGAMGTDLGLDGTKTYNAVLSDLTRDLESKKLLQKEATGQLTPDEAALLNRIRTQSSQLQSSVEQARLQKQLDLIGGKQNLFNFKYGPRNPITLGITGKYRSGGKMTFEERQILQAQKESARKEAMWVKEYNNFLKDKSDYFLKATMPSAVATNDLIKNLYKKTK